MTTSDPQNYQKNMSFEEWTEFENFDPYKGNIESVLIVGGGSSGWMTAAALAKLCPHLEVALIEPKNSKTIGVGESTLGHFNQYLALLDLKDEDWMPACDATYKNGIQFTNFREGKEEVFQYPFYTEYDFTFSPDGINTWSHLATRYPDEFPEDSFSQFYCPNTFLCEKNKQTRDKEQIFRQFDFRQHTAYHLDATKFANYLRDNVALPNGVKHIIGEITGYQTMFDKPNDLNISYLVQDHHIAIQADLYIDCTGFKAQLLEWQTQRFLPYKEMLANDRAIYTRIPYGEGTREEEMRNVTDCYAMDNGWTWTIPLWNRLGMGYVYSARFISPQGAKEEFRQHLIKKLGKERGEAAEFTSVEIEHGRRERAWVNNVCGIGLSYGFVEPLESTGLLTTHENILKLVSILNTRKGYVTRMEKEGFNFSCAQQIDNFRDFLALHYGLSKRTDTPYWRWCTQINFYSPEIFSPSVPKHQSIEQFMNSNIGPEGWHFNMNGIPYIAAGMGFRSVSYPKRSEYILNERRIDEARMPDTKRKYFQWKEYIEKYTDSLPSHYEFLRDEIYKSA